MWTAVAAAVFAIAGQPADTLLYLPLDGTCQPAVGQGPVQVVGQATFVAGAVGQGLVCGEGAAQLQVPRRGNLRPEAGAVALWVKPLDWQADDGKFHVFFEAKGPGWLLLYKYYSPPARVLLLISDDIKASGWQTVSGSVADWRPGQWHHIAASWDMRQARLYIDGKRVAEMDNPPVPAVKAETVAVGDNPWHIERQAKSVIDEVYVFGRPLTDEEVAALYQAGKSGKRAPEVLAEVPAVAVYLRPQGWRRKYVAMVDLSGLEPKQRRAAKITGRLVGPDGRVRWQGLVRLVSAHLAKADVPLQFKPAGKWRFEAAARVGGRTYRGSDSFEMPDTSWMQTRLHEKLELVPPWPALSATGAQVRVWGRKMVVSPVGFSSLSSVGHELLANRCALEVTVGGEKHVIAAGRIRTVERDEAHVVYECRAGDGPVEWRSRVEVQFDGMVRVDGRLVAERAVKVQSVRLVAPLLGRRATLMQYCSLKWGERNGGAVPAGDGLVWRSEKFVPYVWLGDEDCGLMWFCESEKGWRVADGRPMVYVRRVGNRVELVVEPISEEFELRGQWAWTYGLMATPVKPLPKLWRRYRWEPGVNANIRIVWPHPKLMRHFGYPAAAEDDSEFRALVEQKHRHGIMVVPYSCLTFLSEAAPEWKLFSDYWWVTGVADRTASDVKQFGRAFMAVCPRADGLVDFMVWANKRFMEKYRLDGLYHDCTFAHACSNRLHGCGWLSESGATQKTYPIFAHRELYRRVYTMMKSLGRPTYMVAHMSMRVLMPVLSFTDAYLDGEQFRRRKHYLKDYRDALTLDYFRAEFMGRQWGLMPVFLPELAEEARTRRGTRTLLAYTVVHDVPVWAIWCDRKAVDEVRRVLDQFGYVDARFVPYWQRPVETGASDVVASAYVRDGRALVVVSNVGRQDRVVRLKLNRDMLGLTAGRLVAVNAENNAAAKVEGGAVTVDVPGGDLRLVLVETGGQK